MDSEGTLFVDDWDVLEGEMGRVNRLIENCTSSDEERWEVVAGVAFILVTEPTHPRIE